MEFIYQVLPDNVIQALGWTVLHALWQGVLAAGIFALILVWGRKQSARWRYQAGWMILAGMVIASAITFLNVYEIDAATNGEEATRLVPVWTNTIDLQPVASDSVSGLERFLPIVVAFWIIGAFIFLLRLLGGWVYLQRIRHVQTFEPAQKWKDRMAILANRLGVKRKIQLLESALISVPMALGHLKPLVLFPVGAINQLHPDEVEAILAHELVHIARHDYLFNLIQSFLEVIYYFHPAIWWISSRIRVERENCADDKAVALTGDSLTYAKALVRLEETRRPAPVLALAFSGTHSQLKARIRRILHQPVKSSTVMEKITVITLLLAAFALLSFTQRPEAEIPVNDAVVSASLEISPTDQDTIKPSVTQTIVKEEDGRVVEMTMQDGEVTELNIDGEEVDPATQSELVEELSDELNFHPGQSTEGAMWFGEGINEFEVQVDRSEEEGDDRMFIQIGSEDGGEVYEILLNSLGEEGSMILNGEPMIWDNEEGNTWNFSEGTNFEFSSDGEGNIWVNEEGNVWEVIGGNGLNWAFVEEGDFWVNKFGENEVAFYFDIDSLPEEERLALEAEMEELSRELHEREREMAEDYERMAREMEEDIRERMEEIEKEAEYIRREASALESEELTEAERAEIRADQQEALAELRQEAARMAEEATQLAMAEREIMVQERVIMAEEMAMARAEMMEANREMAFAFRSETSFQDSMEEELRRDGLWNEGRYRFDLNSNRLKINGKKQSNEVHEKYLDLWERATGDSFCDGCTYQITNK